MKKSIGIIIIIAILLFILATNWDEISDTSTNNLYDLEIDVKDVIDGDTIRIVIDGQDTSVRFIGVDAPEKNDKRFGHAECYGKEATEYLTNLLSGQTVGIVYDESQGKYDAYDRILAYVYLNGENINQKIIENGYGWEYTYNKPYKYQSEFKQAQNNAKNGNKGLWNTCEGQRIDINEENYATDNRNGNIKGNISNKGEKIYHVPGCSHYADITINESKGEKRFSTEQEAKVAGRRSCIDKL